MPFVRPASRNVARQKRPCYEESMANACFSFNRLSDDELLIEVRRHVSVERQATARLIACLAEFDARRLYLGEGCSSLYTYCTQVLHLSEYAAYARIESARAARRYPVILDMLVDGALHLTAVGSNERAAPKAGAVRPVSGVPSLGSVCRRRGDVGGEPGAALPSTQRV
jgi:hypothetical protein